MSAGTKTLAAIAALLVAIGLSACGGGDGGTTSSSSSTSSPGDAGDGQTQAQTTGGAAKKKDGGQGGQDDNGSSSTFTPEQHSDSGGGSAQFKVKGGDNSVQEFGEEADASETEAAAIALHNFLDARAEGDWDAACRYLSKSTAESFEKLAARAKQIDGSGCGAILEALTNPAAKSAMKAEAKKADVGSLRIEGDRAFVIYSGTGGTVLAIAMANEDGDWKVASLAGTPLN